MAVRHEQHRADYKKDQLQTHVELDFPVAEQPSNGADSDYGSEPIGLPEMRFSGRLWERQRNHALARPPMECPCSANVHFHDHTVTYYIWRFYLNNFIFGDST